MKDSTTCLYSDDNGDHAYTDKFIDAMDLQTAISALYRVAQLSILGDSGNTRKKYRTILDKLWIRKDSIMGNL